MTTSPEDRISLLRK